MGRKRLNEEETPVVKRVTRSSVLRAGGAVASSSAKTAKNTSTARKPRASKKPTPREEIMRGDMSESDEEEVLPARNTHATRKVEKPAKVDDDTTSNGDVEAPAGKGRVSSRASASRNATSNDEVAPTARKGRAKKAETAETETEAATDESAAEPKEPVSNKEHSEKETVQKKSEAVVMEVAVVPSSSSSTNGTKSVNEALMPLKTAIETADLLGLQWGEPFETLLTYHTKINRPTTKIAAFDMDGTLVEPKSGKTHPKDRHDWRWKFLSVPLHLKQLHADGYKVVIFTNQGGIAKGHTQAADIKGKISDLSKEVGVPFEAIIGISSDIYRKPSIAGWKYFLEHMNGGVKIDLEQSFYVGDAAGRAAGWDGNKKTKKDHSCCDRKFAANIGLKFQTPEEMFLKEKPAPFNWGLVPSTISEAVELINSGTALTSPTQEMIVLVGFPASGKSSFTKKYLVPAGYVHINRDTLKTPAKCLSETARALDSGKSVAIDNTNPKIDGRAEYIALAKKKGIPVRCFHMQTTEEVAAHLNYMRERITNGESPHVPRMAYNIFKKNYQEPALLEGFQEIVKVNFKPDWTIASREEFNLHTNPE